MDQIVEFIGGSVLPIFFIIVIVVLIVSYIGSRYKIAGANEALVVSGQRDKSPDGKRNLKVVRGGGVIVMPLIHKVGQAQADRPPDQREPRRRRVPAGHQGRRPGRRHVQDRRRRRGDPKRGRTVPGIG